MTIYIICPLKASSHPPLLGLPTDSRGAVNHEVKNYPRPTESDFYFRLIFESQLMAVYISGFVIFFSISVILRTGAQRQHEKPKTVLQPVMGILGCSKG